MKWYRNLKISVKLIIGFFTIAIIAAVVGVVGLLNINEIINADTMLYEENTLGIAYSSDANTNFQRLRYNSMKLAIVETEKDEEECIATIEEMCSTIDDLLLKFRGTIDSDDSEDIAFYDNLKYQWEEYKGYMQKVIEYNNAGQDAEAENIILIDSDELGTEIRNKFFSLVDDNVTEAEQRSQNNNATATRAFNMLIIIIAFGVIVSIALGIFISRLISKPLKKAVAAADQIALGNVTNVIINSDSKDEIGMLAKSFKKMVDNIRDQALAAEKIAAGDLTVDVPINSADDLLGNTLAEMVKKNNEVLSNIYASSEQVATGAKQISDSSILLSEGATEQASAI